MELFTNIVVYRNVYMCKLELIIIEYKGFGVSYFGNVSYM